MKFLITAVPISPHTRRRTGKAYTISVDWLASTDPAEVEHAYEADQKSIGRDVKVIDVREVS